MGSSASLDRPELSVEPGQGVSAQLRVRNNGSVVDLFTFEGLGTGAAWIEAEPESLSLFPGAEGTVTIHFRPPKSPNTTPGPTPFGIKVVSAEDPMGSAVEEGVITVGRFADRTVELYPLTQRGRRKGTFEVAVDNRGNAPIEVELAGSDPENACRYEFATQVMVVEPGTAHFSKFNVIPLTRFWKGPPKTHQFQVLVTERARHAELPAPAMAAPGGPPPEATAMPVPVAAPPPETVNGALLQEAMLPPWLIKAVIAAIAILLILWILWITLFKPTVESAAKDAVEAPLASLNEKVDALAPADTTPGGGPVGGPTTTAVASGDANGSATTTTQVGNGNGNPDTSPTSTTTTTPTSTFSTPFGNPADFQLGFGSQVTTGGSQDFVNPFSSTFAVTDMVLQNPNGDTGFVQIKRDGNVIMQSALENFRDLDLHFVAPYMFTPGQSLTMTIACTTPGPTLPACAVSGSFGGFQK